MEDRIHVRTRHDRQRPGDHVESGPHKPDSRREGVGLPRLRGKMPAARPLKGKGVCRCPGEARICIGPVLPGLDGDRHHGRLVEAR